MKIQILGGGCPKCQALAANAQQALDQAGLIGEIVKIADMDEISEMGVMVTPAIAIDGVVKKSGKVLSADEIVPFLQEA